MIEIFNIGDKVIYKTHPEYGVGTICGDSISYTGEDCFIVHFNILCGKMSIKYYDLVHLEDFYRNALMNAGAIQPAYKGDKNMNGINYFNNNCKKSVEIHINPDAEICFKSNLKTDEAERMVKLLKETFNKQPVVLGLGNIETEDVELNMFKMPDIVNYKYIEDGAVTIIDWSDGDRTVVKSEYPDTASLHEGFVTACAKKAFGNDNTSNKLFDEWVIKKPKRETDTKIKANAALLEEKRIAEKRKAKREKWAIRKRAAEINREYEARKLAHEKYGTPMDGNIVKSEDK